MARKRRAVLGVLATAIVVTLAAAAAAGLFAGSRPLRSGPTASERLLAAEHLDVLAAQSRLGIAFPSKAGAPAPPAVLGDGSFAEALPPHQVVGFVPWYDTGSLSAADYADMTTIAYDGVDIAEGGAIARDDPAWSHYGDAAFESIVASAHQAGARVLLTVFAQSRPVVDSLARHPGPAAATLAGQLVPLLTSGHLDGVDIDVEGHWRSDRRGFVAFVAALVRDVRARFPGAPFVLDTYAQSASDSSDFFDVAALAPLVDQIFVMAYDMQDPAHASATSPIASPTLGLSDVQVLRDYVKLVAPSKLVLGVPFYGYDFVTRSARMGALLSGADGPTAVTWSAIVAAGHAALWDPVSMTPWYGFHWQGRWHQTWFEDPASIALKTALASKFHLAGVGVWALGMEDGDTSMLGALLGGSPPVKLR